MKKLLISAGALLIGIASISHAAKPQVIQKIEAQVKSQNQNIQALKNHQENSTTQLQKGISNNSNKIQALSYRVNLLNLQTPTHIKLVGVYGSPNNLSAELILNKTRQSYQAGDELAPNMKIQRVTAEGVYILIKNEPLLLKLGNELNAYPVVR